MRITRLGRSFRHILLGASLLAPVAAAAQPTYLDQGSAWTDTARKQFYSQDQGSTMIPMAWFRALKAPDGTTPFLADGLARFGYLPNPYVTNGLPIGFTEATWKGTNYAGMTCAACHTRDISVAGQTYRVDGGPALSDFQALLTEMVDGIGNVLATNASFRAFAIEVLGTPNPTNNQINTLKKDVQTWYARENAMKKGAYSTPDMWGLGRLDAVSMILNRVAGLDLGNAPTYVIQENIAPADAPVRYPFLWNAAFQDKTQWPGFAPNGSDFLGLIRNTGEVFGVFGTFHPKKILFGVAIDYTANNSSNFKGLVDLENMIDRIGPPKFPWPVDPVLAAKGAEVYARNMPGGSCASCHDGANPGKVPFAPKGQTIYGTPLVDVGTDTHEHDILDRRIRTAGVLDNRSLLGIALKFKPCAASAPIASCPTAFSLLSLTVANAIFWSGAYKPTLFPGAAVSEPPPTAQPSDDIRDALNNGFGEKDKRDGKAKPSGAFYESRVMAGIWAAAPYLHNGSVATLDDLLTPDSQRPVSFAVGPNYDPERIGLAAVQPDNRYIRTTTDCTKGVKGQGINSGNSRCGHNFGTNLSPEDKAALLAYLRML